MILHPSFVLPVMPDETPKSSASRVALGIGRSLRGLLRDLGIDFNQFVGGDADAVHALETAFGFPTGVFDRQTFRRVDGLTFVFGSEVLPRDAMRRTTTHVCPVCLAEDSNRAGGRSGRYGRWYWELAQYRCCTTHNCVLVPMAGATGAHFNHHFALQLEAYGDDLPAAEPVATTELSSYLVARLSGVTTESWLSSMPAHAAAKICEMVGVTMNLGIETNWRDVSQVQWVEAGNTGYRQLVKGKEGMISFLEERRAASPNEEFGVLKLYGSLYEFVARTGDPSYAPVTDVIREYILDTTVVAPGARVLGQVVGQRRYHSVRSASVEYGFHPTTLRRHLTDMGVLGHNGTDLPHDRSIFDAAAHAPLLAQLAEAMSRKSAQHYLGVTRTLTAMINPPFVMPVTHGEFGTLPHLFTKTALNALRQRMTSAALPISEMDVGLETLTKTAHRVQASVLDIAKLVFEGRLRTVRLEQGAKSIGGLMVDPAEVRGLLVPDTEMLTLREVKEQIKAGWTVTRGLVRSGAVPSRTERHPLNHRDTVMVSRSDLIRFDATYGSVHGLAKQIGKHGKWLQVRLRAKGMKPAFDAAKIGTEYYRRSTIEPMLSKL